MGLAEQFTNLGDDFLASFDARVNFLGKNRVDTRNHIVDTHRLLAGFHKQGRARARKLEVDLGAFVDDLRETVGSLRRKNQRDRKEAHLAWQRMAKTMASKRQNFKGPFAAAKQKAARAH
ncbi:MAG: hypothetical protein HYT87_10980 [Nitrospirae bacterium]|nr:hypothetical protein [Nitrospirota bacterium]